MSPPTALHGGGPDHEDPGEMDSMFFPGCPGLLVDPKLFDTLEEDEVAELRSKVPEVLKAYAGSPLIDDDEQERGFRVPVEIAFRRNFELLLWRSNDRVWADLVEPECPW